MKIHSKHKDYYDPILYQISSLDHFVRIQDHRKRVVRNELPEGLITLPLDNRLHYLFFCGSVYPFIAENKSKKVTRNYIVRYDANNKPVYEEWESTTSFLWSFNDIRSHLEKHDQLSFCFLETLVNSFNILDTKKLHNIQLKSGVCYFVFKPEYWHGHSSRLEGTDVAGDIILYPSLQDIQFYKIIDPFSAAQQIDYWLGNIFVSDDCPNNQTNAEKIVAHGHDLRISFRDSSRKGKKKNEKKRS